MRMANKFTKDTVYRKTMGMLDEDGTNNMFKTFRPQSDQDMSARPLEINSGAGASMDFRERYIDTAAFEEIQAISL